MVHYRDRTNLNWTGTEKACLPKGQKEWDKQGKEDVRRDEGNVAAGPATNAIGVDERSLHQSASLSIEQALACRLVSHVRS